MGSTLPKGQGQTEAPNTNDSGKPVEAVVCEFNDLRNGEMRVVDVGDNKALLVRENGEYHALSHKCTHYNAPLVNGVLSEGKIRCPWHGACFNIKTGDIEDFPGLDSLQKYQVQVSDGQVKVKATSGTLRTARRVKQMACWSADDQRVFLIIGGGGAAITCAETLRQEGFRGRVVIATKEPYLPYDRPKLSKSLESNGADLALRDDSFYSLYDIEVRKKHEASKVDTVLRTVSFSNGESLNYDKLLIATGGRPRSLHVTGIDLQNICLLRTPDDGNRIAALSSGKRVVVIGSSFIGMEVAAYLSNKAGSVTVVGRSRHPFQASMGERIGSALQKLFESKGVEFVPEAEVKQFEGDADAGHVTGVLLKDGARIQADVCVLGVGVVPATEFLEGSGLDMTKSGHIIVDKRMQTSIAGVFAAGDIVSFPLFTTDGASVSIGHWQMAHAQGRIAGLNLTERDTELRSVPFFWSQMFGKSLRFAGFNAGYDDVVIHGDLDELKFAAFYTKKDDVIAVASMNFDPIVAQAADMFSMGKRISKQEIREDPKSWTDRILGSPV